jgi:hypothetical protein
MCVKTIHPVFRNRTPNCIKTIILPVPKRNTIIIYIIIRIIIILYYYI